MPLVSAVRSMSRWTSILLLALLALNATAAIAEAQRIPQAKTDAIAKNDRGAVRVIVQGSKDRIRRLAAQHGIEVKRQLSQGSALEVTPEQLEALRRDDAVAHISTDSIVQSSMAVATTSIGADQAWEGLQAVGSVTGHGVGIAILDSGIASHTDLGNRVVVSVDFVEPGGDGDDGYGHGTHVAGIAAGQTSGGAGSGVAPAAHRVGRLPVGRVLSDAQTSSSVAWASRIGSKTKATPPSRGEREDWKELDVFRCGQCFHVTPSQCVSHGGRLSTRMTGSTQVSSPTSNSSR